VDPVPETLPFVPVEGLLFKELELVDPVSETLPSVPVEGPLFEDLEPLDPGPDPDTDELRLLLL